MKEHHIYCISNANTDLFENTLTKFTNYLPRNFELNKGVWEIGIIAFGVHLNVDSFSSLNVIQLKTNITDYTRDGHPSISHTTSVCAKKYKHFPYFYETVRNVRYCPLLCSSIRSVEISFVDVNGNSLQLKRGQPSFVHFHFRKKKKAMLSTHLQIDSSMDELIRPNQHINNFEVHLTKPVYLREGAKVALTDISFPNKILNVPDFAKNETIHVSTKPVEHVINFDFLAIDNIYHLFMAIKDAIAENYSSILYINLVEKNGENYIMVYLMLNVSEEDNFTLPSLTIEIPENIRAKCNIEDNIVINSKKPYVVKLKGNLEDFKNVGGSANKLNTFSLETFTVKLKLGKFEGFCRPTPGHFPSVSTLINSLKESMGNISHLLNLGVENNHLTIETRETTNQHYPFIVKTVIKAPPKIRSLYGFPEDGKIDLGDEHNHFYRSSQPIDLYALYPGVMMCYANFIKHSIVGDNFFPLLKMIPLKRIDEEDNYITIHFKNLDYKICNTSRLEKLRFELRRLDGEPIQFETNQKMIYNLSFRMY